MKRIGLFIAIISLACALHAQFYQFVSLIPDSITTGYSGNLRLTVNNGFQAATGGINLRLSHAATGQNFDFGNAPSGTRWNTVSGFSGTVAEGPIAMPANAPLGLYHVIVTGYDQGGTLTFSQTYSNKLRLYGDVGYFQGRLLFDADSSCSVTGGDYGIANRRVLAYPGPYFGISDPNGYFTLALPTGTYTFTGGTTQGLSYVCPGAPHTITSTVSNVGDTTSGMDFYFKSDHQNDISVSVVALNHRPGFTNCIVNVIVTNQTFTPATNINVSLTKHPPFSFMGFSPTPANVSGNIATWNIPSIGPAATLILQTTIAVPVMTSPGSGFSYSATVSCSEAETEYDNNSATAFGGITGSFDPNDKQVWTATGTNADGFIEASDSLLRYLIRFQNTGTDTAFNIYILDTLDDDLDVSTLQVEAASDPYQLLMDSSGHRIKFLFANVLLPDSNINEPESHGFIQYIIRQPGNLPTGTVISNGAGIYFDFNAPVLTNVVHSTICPALATTFSATGMAPQVNFSAPATGNPTSWYWDFGDGNTSTASAPSHTYSAPGTYHVCVALGNACGRSDTICQDVQVIYTGSSAQQTAISGLTLAPQPAREEVRLEMDVTKLSHVQFRILDLQGKEVMHWNETMITGKYVQQLSVANLAPGMYFLHVLSKENQHIVKLMVE